MLKRAKLLVQSRNQAWDVKAEESLAVRQSIKDEDEDEDEIYDMVRTRSVTHTLTLTET